MLYRDFASQEEIDQEYDPARSVDGAAAIGRYRVASEEARAQLVHLSGLAYGPTLAEHLDLFPAQTAKPPLHVFFHGGYWRALSSRDFSFIARGLAPAGVTTAVVNYALCPQVRLSEIVRQCRAALAWLYRNAGRYGYDPSHITLSGHSAGGQILGMLLATDWVGEYGLPRDLVSGAAAISGLFDLAPFPYSWLQPKLQLDWREVATMSPLGQVPTVRCPVSLLVGARETREFHRQSEDYGAWLEHCHPGRKVERQAVAEADHFSVIEGLNAGAGPVYEAIVGQIR